jgi:hypothetical protein
MVNSVEKLKLIRLKDLVIDLINEKIEIESFSPLRPRFSSGSSRVPELTEENEDKEVAMNN